MAMASGHRLHNSKNLYLMLNVLNPSDYSFSTVPVIKFVSIYLS